MEYIYAIVDWIKGHPNDNVQEQLTNKQKLVDDLKWWLKRVEALENVKIFDEGDGIILTSVITWEDDLNCTLSEVIYYYEKLKNMDPVDYHYHHLWKMRVGSILQSAVHDHINYSLAIDMRYNR